MKTRTRYLGALQLHCIQQNPRSQESTGSLKRANLFRTCPAPSICAHFDEKNDNMPSQDPKRDVRAKERRAPWIAERRQSFLALIKTTLFSVGLPWLTFLRPGEMPIFLRRQRGKSTEKWVVFITPHTSLGGSASGNILTWTAHHSRAHKNPRHARHLGFSNARNVDKRWGNLSTT